MTSTALTIRSATDVVPAFQRADIASRLTPLLGTGDSLQRVAQVVQLECLRNPDLLKCDPFSIIDATARILSWHLEPGETAYLVPFGQKCTPMKGYKGMIQMMYDSGHVRSVIPRVVYFNDQFRHAYGLTPMLEHVPATHKSRGEAIGAYCIVKLRGGEIVFHYMDYEEVDAIRQSYSKQWKKGRVPDWYLLKTVIRHTAKYLPHDSRFAEIVARAHGEEQEEMALIADVPEIEATESTEERAAWDSRFTGDQHTPAPTLQSAPVPSDPRVCPQWAYEYVLPGKANAWGGHGGKALGDITSHNLLTAVAAYAKERPTLARLFEAASLVLKWREQVGFPERADGPDTELEHELELFSAEAATEQRGRNAIAEGH